MSTTTKVFVVMEVNWEYNDEYNFREEGGEAKTAWHALEDARKELARLERERWRLHFSKDSQWSTTPSDWTEGEDPADREEAGQTLYELFHQPESSEQHWITGLSVRDLKLDDEHAEEFLRIQAKALKDPITAGEEMRALLMPLGKENHIADNEIDFEDYYEHFIIPAGATDEQIDKVREVFSWINFYEITTIPLG